MPNRTISLSASPARPGGGTGSLVSRTPRPALRQLQRQRDRVEPGGRVLVSGTETVTGGTGRFAGAGGSLSREGVVSVASVAGEFEMSGVLSY